MPNDAQHVREVIAKIRAARPGESVTMLPTDLGAVLNCLLGEAPPMTDEPEEGSNDHDNSGDSSGAMQNHN